MVAAWQRFDHFCFFIPKKAGQQYTGLQLCTGDGQWKMKWLQWPVAFDDERGIIVFASVDVSPHASQRINNTLHGPFRKRFIASQSCRDPCSGYNAAQQAHGRTRIAAIQILTRILQPIPSNPFYLDGMICIITLTDFYAQLTHASDGAVWIGRL